MVSVRNVFRPKSLQFNKSSVRSANFLSPRVRSSVRKSVLGSSVRKKALSVRKYKTQFLIRHFVSPKCFSFQVRQSESRKHFDSPNLKSTSSVRKQKARRHSEFKIRTDDVLFKFRLTTFFPSNSDWRLFDVKKWLFGLKWCILIFGLMTCRTEDFSDWWRVALKTFRTEDVSEWNRDL